MTTPVDRLAASFINWLTFFATDFAVTDWLIEPVLPSGRATVIFGKGGVGKSLLALYLAACLATGRRCLDQPA